jgi:O-antigen/teichoic acid export membrane protein
MSTVRRSVAFAVAESQLTFAIQFVTAIVIARLLTPSEIGVYSIAFVVLSLAHVLRDFGVVSYLIKEPELSEGKVRAASAISFTLSWTIALAIFLAGFPIAWFYDEPRLRPLVWVLATNFVMIPFGAISMAVIRREMRMGRIFAIRTASAVVGSVLSIVLALLGFGSMSLALGNVANTATTMIGARLSRPAWLKLWPSFNGVRGILTFSGQSLASNLLIESSRAAPDAVLGRVQGPAFVALYGRASGLVDVFARFMSQAMWSVTLPYFSKVGREGGAVGHALAHAQAHLVGIAWPFYAVLGLSAHPVMLTLFGEQWLASIPVLHWLAGFGAATTATMFASTALIAADRAGREVRMSAKVHGLRIAVIVSAASFGIVPLAIGLSCAALVEIAIVGHEVKRTLDAPLRTMAAHYARSALLAAWTAIPALVVVLADRMQALRLVGLTLLVAASAAAWLSGVFLVRHPIAGEVRALAARVRASLH